MKRMGMKTGGEGRWSWRMMVKPISFDPFRARDHGEARPSPYGRTMFLEHDDGVIDHEADGERQRHEREVVQ